MLSARKKIISWLLFLLILILPLLMAMSPSGVENKTIQLISLSPSTDLHSFRLRFEVDPLMVYGNKAYFLVGKKDLEEIEKAGFIYTVENNLLRSLLSEPNGRKLHTLGGLNGAYHSYQELNSELKTLASRYKNICRLYTLGQSLENRKILALKISDNPGLVEDEPRVAFIGCHHAREWISVEVPFLLARYLLENYHQDERIKLLVDSSEIWIVPLLNPDGLEYSIINYRLWRKNRRFNFDGSYGVDLNRNYSYRWGYDNLGSSPEPASGTYRGAYPFSEPEVEAIRNLFSNRNFSAAISYHSYSQAILYPWGYINQPTPIEPLLQQLASEMADLIFRVNGRLYEVGRASSLLYLTNGDFTDWAYGYFGIPAFTIELPPLDRLQGGFLNSEQDIDSVFQENLPAALHLIEWAITNYQTSNRPLRPQEKKEVEKESNPVVNNRLRSFFKGKENK